MSMGVRSEWVEHAHAVLDRAGHRKARARNALIDLLAGQPCALSALEIEDRLRESEQRVARASIYRILELLGEHGLVARLELGDGTTRYELIDPGGEHHHHLVCDQCGRVVPFDDRDLERAIERLTRRLEFRADEHEVVLHGACSDCQNLQEPATGGAAPEAGGGGGPLLGLAARHSAQIPCRTSGRGSIATPSRLASRLIA